MSGPKDFGVIFAAARLAEIESRRRAEQRARQAAAEARRVQQQKIAEKRIAEMAAIRVAQEAAARRRAGEVVANLAESRKTIARLAAAKLENSQQAARRRVENQQRNNPDVSLTSVADNAWDVINDLAVSSDTQAQATATTLSNELSKLNDSKDSTTIAAEDLMRIQREANDAREAAAARARQLPQMMKQVMSWQSELGQDQAADQFCKDQMNDWQTEATSLVNDYNAGKSTDALINRCQESISNAEKLSREAGNAQAAFNTRNELLSDVIASLQEIGFYVADPSYEDPKNPTGAVLIKAVRGREEVSASIDLSSMVRSVWNGVGDEHCKDAFFHYVDQMRSKGVDVKPTRIDLQDRPKLKKKGEQSVPDSQQYRHGM